MLRPLAVVVMLGALAACGGGCDPSASAPSVPSAPATPQRIVSLSPAITSTIVALGAGESLVGRTPWCGASPREVAIAWDGVSVDAERMIALRPTLVVYQQTVSGGPADEVKQLAQGRDWTIHAWRLDRLDDVRAMISGVGDSLGDDGRAKASEVLKRFDHAFQPDPNATALGRTLLLFGTDPPTAFGPGSYVDDLWRALGGTNVISSGAYPELTVEELVRLDPDWVIVVGSDAVFEAARKLPMSASKRGSVIHAADHGLLEPGAAVVPAVEALRRALAESAR